MRESFTYGSVGRAPGNRCLYPEIESTFSSVRLRTAKVRSCFSSMTVVTMAFKLCQSAQKRWQRLHHSERLAAVIKGVKFINGIEENRNAA